MKKVKFMRTTQIMQLELFLALLVKFCVNLPTFQ